MESGVMNENKRKLALWALAAILVLAAAGGFYYANKNKPPGGESPDASSENGGGNASSTTPTSTTSGSKPATAKPASKPPRLVNDVTAPSLTYTQAIAIFESTLIAFNEECKIIPTPMYIRNGTTVMFDNRSRNPRIFKLDGVSYTIPGYGFKLFQLRSTKIPRTVQVQCGTNTGEITLN